MPTNTGTTATKEKYAGTKLWKPWMDQIQLIQLTDLDEVQELLNQAKGQHIAWDVETSSLDANLENVVGHCFSLNDSVGYYVPVAHSMKGSEFNLDRDKVWDMLIETFMTKDTEIFVYNYKFEGRILRSAGVNIPTIVDGKIKIHDVYVYRWLYKSEDLKLDLKSTVHDHLRFEMLEIHEVPQVFHKVGKKKVLNFGNTDPEDATLYAAADPVFTYRWYREKVENDPERRFCLNAPNTMYDVVMLEHELLDSLFEMEEAIEGTRPVYIDRDALLLAQQNMSDWVNLTTAKIWYTAGQTFNISSPAQIGKLLETKYQLEMPRTDKGNYKTDEAALVELQSFMQDEDYGKDKDVVGAAKLVSLVLTHRHLLKQQSTYIKKLLDYTKDEPYARFVFKSTGCRTGRFSSGGVAKDDTWYTPFNAQNVPNAGKFQLAPTREILNPDQFGEGNGFDEPTLVGEFTKLLSFTQGADKTKVSFSLETHSG